MNPTPISSTQGKSPAHNARALWLKRVRQWHLYLGTLFAPSIIFFALSGALQLFGLHEGHPGRPQPVALFEKLGSLHKDQTLALKHGPPPSSPAEGKKLEKPEEDHGPGEERPVNKAVLGLKAFFLATSIGLLFTTCLGVFMAFQYNRSRSVVWTLLLIGTVIPAVLIAMTA